MSVISKKTTASSILKTYSTVKRQTNSVVFEFPKNANIKEILTDALKNKDKSAYFNLLDSIKSSKLKDDDYLRILAASRECISIFSRKHSLFVEQILSLNWLSCGKVIATEYESFLMDLLVIHSQYCKLAIDKLITYWIPKETDEDEWPLGSPSIKMQEIFNHTLSIISKLIESIPMTFDIILETIEKSFPYHNKATYVIAGYVHNVLQFIDEKPMFRMINHVTNDLITLLINKLIILDINSPRHDIEIEELTDDEMIDNDNFDDDVDNDNIKDDKTVKENETKHTFGHTLDICMEKIMNYFFNKYKLTTMKTTNKKQEKYKLNLEKLFNSFLLTFEKVLLRTYNTHHVQFLLFYFCSLKEEFFEKFIKMLWHKICDPNVIPVIRQSAIGYIASILARGKFVKLSTLRGILKDMCNWAHQYIDRSDSMKYNTLKSHIVFYTVCQAIFYIIAFKSRHLTNDKKNIIFLQSLQLSSLVTSHLNPLKVCLPTIVQAFAGITRAHQIAYCHTIIEKNTRRKLATVYLNELKPDEILDTFFPFDPCLLKRTLLKIDPIYIQYSNCNNNNNKDTSNDSSKTTIQQSETIYTKRKRTITESSDNLDDDFLIMIKKQKFDDLSKEFDNKYTYDKTPGFHKIKN